MREFIFITTTFGIAIGCIGGVKDRVSEIDVYYRTAMDIFYFAAIMGAVIILTPLKHHFKLSNLNKYGKITLLLLITSLIIGIYTYLTNTDSLFTHFITDLLYVLAIFGLAISEFHEKRRRNVYVVLLFAVIALFMSLYTFIVILSR